MTSFQCPNCGADLQVEDARQGYVVCRYCDSRISLTDDRTAEQNRAEAERIRAETERMAFDRRVRLEEEQRARTERERQMARERAEEEAAQREQAAQEAREAAVKREIMERQERLAWQKDNTRKCGIISFLSLAAWIGTFIIIAVTDHESFFATFLLATLTCACPIAALVFLVKALSSKWKENHM